MEEPILPPPSEPPQPPPPPPARGVLGLLVPALRAALYLIVYFILQTAVVVLVTVLARLAAEDLFRRGGLGSSNEVFLAFTVITLPPQLAVTWLFVRFLDRRSLASIGLRRPAGGSQAMWRQLVIAPLGAVAVLGAWLALALALPSSLAAVHYGGISPDLSHGPAWWPLPPGLLLVALLIGFLLQGGLEELIVRGYVYHTLRERWRPWAAALGSSVLFALLHLGNPDVSVPALLNIVLAGMVLTALVERTGSLWSATLAHGAWNFALACLLSVPVSGVPIFHLLKVAITGDPGLTGDGFGPEGSWLLTLIGVALTAALWRGLWRRPSERAAAVARPSAPEDGIPPLSS
ncbi:MAG TPA: CPBP family intramembrane glutamic endopeptidase [Thermoanaerobaculia bacterium]